MLNQDIKTCTKLFFESGILPLACRLPATEPAGNKAVGKRASYNWQQSNDNGTTWADLPITLRANTTVSGLTPGSRVTFRVRAITTQGTGNWTQPVSVIVL